MRPRAAIRVDVTMRDFSRLAFRYAHGPLAAKSNSRDFINCHLSGFGPFMIQVEVLDESVSWPFTIPPRPEQSRWGSTA